MSVTCLKMVGRWGEANAAVRLRKPVSGTVVGGVGPVGKTRGKNSGRRTGASRADVASLFLKR